MALSKNPVSYNLCLALRSGRARRAYNVKPQSHGEELHFHSITFQFLKDGQASCTAQLLFSLNYPITSEILYLLQVVQF